MSTLKKVQPGQELVIPAASFNSFVDAAVDLKKRQTSGGRGVQADSPAPYVLVKNASGSDAGRFGVLGIDAPVISPDDNLDEFKSRVVLSGVEPTAAHAGRFVILLEPLAAGAMGRACIVGACPVKVDMVSEVHAFADAEAGETGHLKSGSSGSARILWAESGTGEKWGVVLIGAGPINGDLYWFSQHYGNLSTMWPGALMDCIHSSVHDVPAIGAGYGSMEAGRVTRLQVQHHTALHAGTCLVEVGKYADPGGYVWSADNVLLSGGDSSGAVAVTDLELDEGDVLHCRTTVDEFYEPTNYAAQICVAAVRFVPAAG